MNDTLKSHFLNLYSMALSDTEIDTTELEALYRIGRERGIEKSEIDQLILNPDTIRFTVPDTLDQKIVYLYDFARIIIADGIVDRNERNTLELFCVRFGFEDENINGIADFLIDSAKKNIPSSDLLRLIDENLN